MASSYFLNVVRSGLGIFISRIFGLIRDMVIAGVYGATGLTDIFFVAFAIPNLFRQFFVEGAMSSAFMPFLAEKLKIGGVKMQNTYMTQLVIVQSILISIITLIIMLAAEFTITLFIPGYSHDQALISTGAHLLRIVMPFLVLISFAGLFSGFLNLYNGYFISYASSALFNIMMIVGAWVGYKYNNDINYLAYGVIAGGLAQCIVVYFISVAYGYKPVFVKKLDDAVKKTYLLIVPSLAGVSISQLNFLIGRVIASYLVVGSISWLFYANRLFQFPLGVFSVAIGVVSLTELSKARVEAPEKRNGLIDKAMLSLFTIIIPATIGLIVLSKEMITLIFYRNAFTLNDVEQTSIALQMYSAGLIFFSLINLLTRVFHSDKNTKTPVKAAFAGFIVNIILNIVLMKILNHAGIALASSIAAVVNAAVLYKMLPDYKFSLTKHKGLIVKLLFANIAMLIAVLTMKYFAVNVLINIGICIVIYAAVLYVMKVNILRLLR